MSMSDEFSLNAHAVMHSDDFSFVDVVWLCWFSFFQCLFLVRQSFHLLCNVFHSIECQQLKLRAVRLNNG